MRIGVIGAGYVGLTTAACLAEMGYVVFCAESNPEKLKTLRAGQMPHFEPYLDELMKKNQQAGRLQFGSTSAASAACEALFICVGTPLGENGEVDISAIEGAAKTIAHSAQGYRLVVQKSTVPVGGCDQLQKLLEKHRPVSDGRSAFHWDVVANPEFLREGSAVQDFLHPDRIVIGVENDRAAESMREIYRPIVQRQFVCPIHSIRHDGDDPVPFVITGARSAELIKHTANSFLAMKISFINLVADLCEAVGCDVEEIVEGIGMDHRIGPSFLRPGIGFGGSCFPKDVQGFIRVAEKFGCDFSLLKEVEKINQNRIGRFVGKVREELGDLRGRKIGVWGLAFKPNTDDIRNSPAIAIVRCLLAEGAAVQAFDPQAMTRAKLELPEVRYCRDAYEAAAGAAALLILTEWLPFREIDLHRLHSLMFRPLIIDGRNAFPAEEAIACGIEYIAIGQKGRVPVGTL